MSTSPPPASTPARGGAGAASVDDNTPCETALAVPCYMGTCGWTDDTLLQCGRFYAPGTRTPIARLKQYARSFPCVEIDTSTYAIPRRDQVREWMSVVPPGFKFHIKAFGLFPSRAVTTAALPRTSLARTAAPPTQCDDCGVVTAVARAARSLFLPVSASCCVPRCRRPAG